jgi:nucleotide sugar dehydrogenase
MIRNTVSVVGLGKIGLPLATQYAHAGWKVIGIDINPSVVELVNQAVEPFPGEDGLKERLAEVTRSGLLRASSDFADIRESEVIIVVVPVIVNDDGSPDFKSIDSATHEISQHIASGAVIIYETTLPVGTTRKRFIPMLQSGGQTVGKDFFVGFSPERVFTGRVYEDLARYPKLIGGYDESSSKLMRKFYESVLTFDQRSDLQRANGVWDLGTLETAELAKLAETTYRNVNIAFANELALYSEKIGVNVYEVIEASNSQPFSHIHLPGISVGGHCIPVYPKFYLSTNPDAKIPQDAVDLNEKMPVTAISRLSSQLDGLNGKTVGVLGLSYRPGVKETAFSGTLTLLEELNKCGAIALVHDPYFTSDELARIGLRGFERGYELDALIVHTAHDEYRALTHDDFPGLAAVYDGRRILQRQNFPGVKFHTVGIG